MIWALLVFVGVPLWLCAMGIFALIFRNRGLRRRHGDIPVGVLRPGKTRWTRGHAVWVSDVFAWRGSPAAWNEDLSQVSGVTVRSPTRAERKRLHRLGDDPVVAVLTSTDGVAQLVAVRHDDRDAVLGPAGDSTNAKAGA